MNILTFILNRVYTFLCKVKNQSPLFGASILVGLLILGNVCNIIMTVYAFRTEYFKPNVTYFIFWFGITFLVLRFASKHKRIISNTKKKVPLWKNLSVLLLFVFSTVITVYLANINREKIYAERKAKHPTEQPVKQNSLEGKIRDWWNNRDK